MMDITLDDRANRQIAALRGQLDMSDTELIHLAIQRLHNEVFVNQEPDDGPLSEEYLQFLQSKAQEQIGNQLEFDQSLFK